MDARVKPGHDGFCNVLRPQHRPPQSSRPGEVALSVTAQAQPGRLVAMGAGGVGGSQALESADHAVDRLRRLSLVPRDGAREFRGRGDRRGDERAVRQHQSRPRGTAGYRSDLHERAASARRAGRLASDHVSDAIGRAGVGRHLFSERIEIRPAGLYRHLARSITHVSRRAAKDRAEPRRLAGAAGRPGAAGRQGRHRAQGTRRRR